jgi:hypothetical protein
MRSKRAGARREMLRRIKAIKSAVQVLHWWWTAESTVWPERRERRQSEYPENQRRYWLATVEEIDALSNQLAELRQYAIEQYQLTPVRESSDAEAS